MVGLLVLAALVLAACGGSDSSGTDTGASTTTSGGGEEAKIAAFIVDSANIFDTALSEALKNQASKEGASIDVFSAENDPQKQVAECSDALATNKYNVFLIKAVAGPTMMPCAREAIAKGDVVVAVDSPLGPQYTLKPQVEGIAGSILSLPTTNGKALAEMTNEACEGKQPCNVAYYYGPPQFVFASQTRKSFLETVENEYPDIAVVEEGTWNFDLATAYNLTKTLLAKQSEIDVITLDGDPGATGAIKALKEAGELENVKVIGGGGSHTGAAQIEAGEQFGTSALYPESMGDRSVELGIKALNGEPLGENEIDETYLSPLGPKITKANVEKFEPQWG